MDDSVNHDSAFGGDEPLPESFGSDARAALLDDLKSLIEGGRRRAAAAVNSALTITYWHVGRRINENILNLCSTPEAHDYRRGRFLSRLALFPSKAQVSGGGGTQDRPLQGRV